MASTSWQTRAAAGRWPKSAACFRSTACDLGAGGAQGEGRPRAPARGRAGPGRRRPHLRGDRHRPDGDVRAALLGPASRWSCGRRSASRSSRRSTPSTRSWARFVDMYWHDPRMIGLDYIPDGLRRPADCYIGNQHGNMERMNRPALSIRRPACCCGPSSSSACSNPMALHNSRSTPTPSTFSSTRTRRRPAATSTSFGRGRRGAVVGPLLLRHPRRPHRTWTSSASARSVTRASAGSRPSSPSAIAARRAAGRTTARAAALPPAHRPAGRVWRMQSARLSLKIAPPSSAHLLLLGALLRQHRDLPEATDDLSRRSSRRRVTWTRSPSATTSPSPRGPRCHTSSPRRCRRRRT